MSRNTSTSQIRKNISLIILGVAVLIVSIISIANWYQLAYPVESLVHSNTLMLHQREYDQSKLQFCYDRQIHPCDDTSVAAWNEQHSGDPFTIKTVEQLGKEVKF